jgi:two-component system aerobic respiration control sensor histidine kinase ArcB
MIITKTQKFWLESDFVFELLKQIPASVFWKNVDSVYLGCNDAFAHSLGLSSPEEVIGKTDYDLPTTKEESAAFRAIDKQVIESKQPKINIEEYQTLSDGRIVTLLTNKVPLLDKQNNVVGILGIYYDITERKKKEEELREAKEAAEAASRTKTEFLANMRHDIRTPLTGIIGFARLIKEETKDSQIAEYSDNMLASSQALLEFLNEILEAIRVTTGEIPLLKKKFDLKAKLQSVIALLQAKAQEKKLSLILNYDENIPRYLIGDAKRIHRIFLELIANAINFTHQGKIKAAVTLAQRKEHEVIIKITVADTGIGIPADKKEEIFVRFNRLTPSYEGIYKGAGLGLTLVKQFMDDLNGEIYVESAPQQGSTFTCFIPLKIALVDDEFGIDRTSEITITPSISPTANVVTPLPQNIISVEQAVAHILLVEDQIVAAKATEGMLQKLNCVVDIATTGEAALMQIKKKEYDLILMDVGLPDISGNEVTRQIREWELAFDKYIPILALTAHVESDEKQACIEAGMDAVLSKPLAKETAIDILNAFIPKRAAKKVEVNKQDLLQLSGPVLDFESGAKIYSGNTELVKEMLQMLVDSFPDELTRLKKAHQKNDWQTIQVVAHKLRGGACYCGTSRLQAACIHLERYLKTGSTKLREELYQQLLNEIQAVRKQVI